MMIQIRPAALSDCPGIARVQVDSYRTAYRGIFPDSYLEQFSYEEQTHDWIELITYHTEDILLVAETAQGQVVGYVLAREHQDIHPGYDAEIIALHVLKTQQKQGTGGRLLRQAVALLKQRGCQNVMLWTLKANPIRRWYKSLGGKLIAEKRFQVDDCEVVEVAYGWQSLGRILDE